VSERDERGADRNTRAPRGPKSTRRFVALRPRSRRVNPFLFRFL